MALVLGKGRGKRGGGTKLKPPPAHKAVPTTTFCVDALGFEASAFFVSHAHADHISGLHADFRRGPIYCSVVTARVLVAKFPGLEATGSLRPLEPRERLFVEGVAVTLVDANHCPGAVQFIFELKDGRVFVHSGDMRYHPSFQEDPILEGIAKRVTTLYLDTTYCNPRYVFPSQEESIDYIAAAIAAEEAAFRESSDGAEKPLFLIATYSIGKEKILKAVAARLSTKIQVTARKMNVLSSLQDPELDAILTTDKSETRVHVVHWGTLGQTFPYFQPNFEKMEQCRLEAGAGSVTGFVPTGWMYEMKKETFGVRTKDVSKVHLVPYSEHSNFEELREYVRFLRPEHVIPTVGAEGDDGKSATKMTDHFKHLMDETASKRRFIESIGGASGGGGGRAEAGASASASPNSGGEGKSGAGCFSEQEAMLSAIIPEAPAQVVSRLIALAKGDVEKAVNMHFDMSFTSGVKRHKGDGKGAAGGSPARKAIGVKMKSEFPESSPVSLSLSPAKRSRKSPSEHQALVNANLQKSVEAFDPEADSPWRAGEAAQYMHIASAFALIERTKKRLEISTVLANAFRALLRLSPSDLLPALYLTLGKVAPDYEGVELNIGGRTVAAAITEATGVTRARMSELYKKTGDLGDIAQQCKQNQRTLAPMKALLVSTVFGALKQIAGESGPGSAGRRKALVLKLLRSCRGPEIKYLTRTLIQNLRVGASRISVLSALGRAAAFHFHDSGGKPTKEQEQRASETVNKAYAVCPNLDLLVAQLLGQGLDGVAGISLTPGVPVKPMLAKPAGGLADAVKDLGKASDSDIDSGSGNGSAKFIAEWKYDGVRCQIHRLESGEVKIFSRNCEDRTESFPDVQEIVRAALPASCRSIVLDGEIVAIDRETGELRSFQELSGRARRDVEMSSTKVDVCVFLFDLLGLDGDPLMALALSERLRRMEEVVRMDEGKIESAKRLDLSLEDPKRAEEALSEAMAAAHSGCCEGLMLKALSSAYEPDTRSDQWLKLKRDYCEDLSDSLDLVPIGAWYGNGRKAGWFSPILLAVWNPESEQFESACRCLSGFSDEFYKKVTKEYGEKLLPSKPPYYSTGESPSVWFEASEVWELRGADLTISPVHLAAAGLVDESRGISVRFPRFLRRRPEKALEEATSSEQIAAMYRAQTRKSVKK